MNPLYATLQQWSAPALLALQVVVILLGAWIVQRLVARALKRIARRYLFAPELALVLRGSLRALIWIAALIAVLGRIGVSATVLWTAVSGFVAVAAIAFFAIWSVLSNLLCAILIFTVGAFRLGDEVELVDAADKPGLKGRVVAINLLYTTLSEGGGAQVQIPNSMFFQKAVRRWRGGH